MIEPKRHVHLTTARTQSPAGEGLPQIPAWMQFAACATTGFPDLWFADKGQWDRTRTAKAICEGCEVRTPCAEAAIANGERWGVWGALTEQERRTLRRNRREGAA